jgi:hypothetical protein
MLAWTGATDAIVEAESDVAGLLRPFHDGSGGDGTVGLPMPPPHPGVIVL